MKCKFVSYTENLLEISLQNWQRKTLFLFPNEASAQKAQFLAQQKRGITDSVFYSMEAWKNELFFTSLPILQDEKRNLLWYLSLSEAHKRFFSIHSYKQSLSLSHYFFDFWQEIKEELITPEKMEQVIHESYASENQLEMFEKWKEIYQNYQNLLREKKVTDEIFLKNIENINFSQFRKFEKAIVVNQFYFSKLEKELLKHFPVRDVTIYLQMPKEAFDTKNLRVISDDFWQNAQTENFHLFAAKNSTQMIMQLANTLSENEIQAIVDFRLRQQPYFSFLARQKFQLPADKFLLQSNFGQFIRSAYGILKGMIQDDKELLVPLQALIKAFLQPHFFNYFRKDEITQDEVMDFLQFYAEQSFLFVDWNGKWLSFFPQETPVKAYFQHFFTWLKDLAKISSPAELVSFIDYQNNNLINLVSTSQERYSSTFYDSFYEVLADFASLDSIIEPEEWQQIIGTSKNKSAEILSLLLGYLSCKKFRYVFDDESAKRKCLTLQDTRNLQFDSLAILNVVEGTLPAVHQTPFLFSEHQRQKLGLKTYDDILKRDKYYFMRALAQSKKVFLFTIDNLEENIEPSSYLQELEWKGINFEKHSCNFSYKTFYHTDSNETVSCQIQPIKDDFFTVPFSETDFSKKKIQLSAYPFMQVLKEPYLFYWQHVLKLKPKLIELANDYEAKFIGNFVHEIFSLIWQRLKDVYQGEKIHHHFSFTNKLYVEDASKHLRQIEPKFRYISPHNFADTYFEHILLPFLQQSIHSFFYELENRFKLTDKLIKIRFEENLPAIKWLSLQHDWQLFMKAKADLLIETENDNYIFDYKTGKHHSSDRKSYELQLAFYELFYYLLPAKKDNKTIKSFLYFVMDNKFHVFTKKDKQSFFAELDETMTSIFHNIFENGYILSEKKSGYEDENITRRDLYKRMKSCTKK